MKVIPTKNCESQLNRPLAVVIRATDTIAGCMHKTPSTLVSILKIVPY